jgi:hypothetical protein
MHDEKSQALHRLLDKSEIYDAICRYARGVDRGDWDLVRSTYHPDAHDDHVEYKGGIEGLIEWLDKRFAGIDNSMHFLGNCLIEFTGPDLAFVETYFTSRRLRTPSAEERGGLAAADALCREAWGRYADRFERRQGEWRVARRLVVIDSRFTSVAKGGARNTSSTWGTRDPADPSHAVRADILRDASA